MGWVFPDLLFLGRYEKKIKFGFNIIYNYWFSIKRLFK